MSASLPLPLLQIAAPGAVVDCELLALCRDDRVVVVAELEPGAQALLPGLQSARAGQLVQLELRPSELVALAETEGVVRIREPFIAHPQEITSEGLGDLFDTEDWHAAGVTGEGLVIAVFDVGFLGYEELLGTELPDEVRTHFYSGWDDIDHGTSVSEIVHDVAPGAELRLYYFWTDVEFLESIETISSVGDIDIVNASIGFENIHHTDGTSVYSEAVTTLTEQGVHWFNAAGNEAENSWTGTLGEAQGIEFYGHGPGNLDVNLRWEDAWGASTNDLNLVVEDSDGAVCGRSTNRQDGDDDPYEQVRCKTDNGERYGVIRVEYDEGVDTDLQVFFWSNDGMVDAKPRRSLVLPSDAFGANSIGAVFWESDELAWYSSWGPTDDGRQKPDLSAPTYVTVASGEGWFGGTSCATPHVSGAAALVLQQLGPMTPEELTSFLRERTVDLGAEGWDPAHGAGYLAMGELPQSAAGDSDADSEPPPDEIDGETPTRGCGCGGGAPLGGLAVVLAFCLSARRRDRHSPGPRSRPRPR